MVLEVRRLAALRVDERLDRGRPLPAGLEDGAADGKFVLRGTGTKFGLIPKPEGTKAEHTAVGFEVDDVAAEIKALKARGVAFHDYDFPGFKTIDHMIVIGTDKAAWFSDTEGNILCIHQDVRKSR